jgi:hypothetical protein
MHERRCVIAEPPAPLTGAGAPGARAHLRRPCPDFQTEPEATDKHPSVAAVFARHGPA